MGKTRMKFSRHPGRMTPLRAPIQQGFSLIELMIAIALLGILLAIAVPSFTDAVLGSKLRSYANNFLASTYQARGEAIKRNSVVKLCASSNGTSCTGSWEQGWIVMAGTTVIQRQPALSSGMKMTESADVGSIDFPPTGVGVTSATLTLCRATPSAGNQERVISINSTGRASIAKTTAGSCP
jgi:type IV fimbrial biogenesis protein FimT